MTVIHLTREADIFRYESETKSSLIDDVKVAVNMGKAIGSPQEDLHLNAAVRDHSLALKKW